MAEPLFELRPVHNATSRKTQPHPLQPMLSGQQLLLFVKTAIRT